MKILAIGRNYAAHIEELKNERADEPVVFLKPDTALLTGGAAFPHPAFSDDVHHEIEVVLRVSKAARDVTEADAPDHYDAVGLGVDFTARDLQQSAKQRGWPWALAKSFDGSAPVSGFLPKATIGDLRDLDFYLNVNGATRQRGNTSLMIFSFDFIVAYLSRYFTLQPGDLIFTGTPEGVAAVRPGDHLEGYLDDQKLLDCRVV
ncbi:MAG: fumarylacetoacetate hydrolase family protein [Catalinimonas sp.]